MKNRMIPVWCVWIGLLWLISGSLFAQGQPMEVTQVRFQGDFEQQEWDDWLHFGDRWLEDDRDYTRFLLGKAEFQDDNLTLVVMGYLTGGCWSEGEASLKDDKILLTLKCEGEAGPSENLEIMEFTVAGVEQKPYKVFVERLESDPRYRGEGEDDLTGKLHRRAKEVRGVSYFKLK